MFSIKSALLLLAYLASMARLAHGVKLKALKRVGVWDKTYHRKR